MKQSPRKALIVSFVLAVISVGVWVVLRLVMPRPGSVPLELPLKKGGVKLSLLPLEGAGQGRSADGAPGDWLLESDKVRLVVGADAPGAERRQRFGALIDLVAKDFVRDELVDLRTILHIQGKHVPTRVSSVSGLALVDRPALRVTQFARDGQLMLETDLQLTPGQAYVELVTRVSNLGHEPVRGVQVGDRTRWPGGAIFAPRAGFVRFTSHAELWWLARRGNATGYGLVFPERPVDAGFFFDRVGPVGQVTLSRAVDLPPQGTLEFRRRVIVVDGGLHQVAEVAYKSQRKPYGRIVGSLKPVPTWAVIEARYADGRPALSVRADARGHYELPLAPGEYRLVLRAPGGEDTQPVTVKSGAQILAQLMAPEAGHLKFAVVDSEGIPLAARILVRGVSPTLNPDFEPFEAVVGAQNIVYTQTGEGGLELPPGRYDILASHGSEYSVYQQELEINSEIGAAFRAVLENVVETPGWIGCDFHLHQSPSFDSVVALDERVVSLLAEGVEFAVPTDHNHVTDLSGTISGFHAEGLLGTAPGIEITTPGWGHFNAYPYALGMPLPPHAAEPTEIFSTVRARAPDAVIQVNHPRMPGVGYFNRGEVDAKVGTAESEAFSFDFDALEVVNGFDLENGKLVDANIREWFELLNAGRRYTAIGNSDSHRLAYAWAGFPRTYVRVADDQPIKVKGAEIAHSVKRGHVVVANGIFVMALANGTAGPGDQVSSARISLQISIRAPAWADVRKVEVWTNNVLYTSKKLPPSTANATKAQLTVDLDLENDTWIVVLARGEKPMERVLGKYIRPIGFTNPIYVDANEDGVFKAQGAPTVPPVADEAPVQ